MGIALWMACALVLFAAARFVPFGRPVRWIGELSTALTSAMLFGFLATYLDFGGWNELEWRAGVFVFFGAATVVGVVRATGVAFRGSGVGDSNRFAATKPERQTVKSRTTSSPTPDPRHATPADPTPDSRPPTPAYPTPDSRHATPAK